uniref:Cullin family profile domain-containing protein n=1 Tax=Paramoeba aestuarina TaxID=180227 RepID=A0A7S4K5Q3_9EUKA
MADYLKNYVKGSGAELVTDKERDSTLVQSVLEMKRKLDTIHTSAFDKNELFRSSIRDGLEHFLNLRGDRTSELVAKFVDSKLRAGAAKSYSDEELETLLNDVMSIFRHINGKDVFEAFYKKDLSKRLLLGRSASIDAEKLMISKLRNECGSAFTSKMEGMFKDVDVSKDLMESFKQSKAGQSIGDIDLSVHVLTMGFWPPVPNHDPNLPTAMSGYLETFKKFYLDKRSSRRLTWQHSLGHCILKVNFPKGKKELSVSLFQALVMLLFNEKDVYTFVEIKEKTGLEDKELRRILQSLAVAKIRVLGKKPMTKDVNDDDRFCINQNFKQQLFRIKINQIQAKETKEEVAKTNQAVFLDRQYQVDACVVRIMKTRKTLTHNLLLAELYKQLKFPLETAMIKKRIESLIEREFIEEDEENSSIYKYVA